MHVIIICMLLLYVYVYRPAHRFVEAQTTPPVKIKIPRKVIS